MESIDDKILQTDTLFHAATIMEQIQTDSIPVISEDESFAGIITKQKINKKINKEQLKIVD